MPPEKHSHNATSLHYVHSNGNESTVGNSPAINLDRTTRSSNVQEAVKQWELFEECNDDFFSMKNYNESEVLAWYSGWLKTKVEAHPEEYAKFGEYRFFAKHAWNGGDIICSISTKGCSRYASREDIMKYLWKHKDDKGHEMTADEVLVLARNIFVMQTNIFYMAKFFDYAHVSIIS